jgi:hypothetical protein
MMCSVKGEETYSLIPCPKVVKVMICVCIRFQVSGCWTPAVTPLSDSACASQASKYYSANSPVV